MTELLCIYPRGQYSRPVKTMILKVHFKSIPFPLFMIGAMKFVYPNFFIFGHPIYLVKSKIYDEYSFQITTQ